MEKSMSASRILLATTLIAGLSPCAAVAQGDFFVCRDTKGLPMYITLESDHRRVSTITGRAPFRCLMVFTDGTHAPVYRSYNGESCADVAILGDDVTQVPVHQFVRITDGMATYGIRDDADKGSGLAYHLNLTTGILDAQGDIMAECHRPHS
jgi:hypothetical protein